MADAESYGAPIVMEVLSSEALEGEDANVLVEDIDFTEEQRPAEDEYEGFGFDEEEDDDDESGYSTDEIDDIYESQLLDAQQQWDESIEQLNKVLNWVLLPIVGKFMGRRVAKAIWQRVMEHLWR
mgnify:CR=1 FL=1